MVHSDQVDLDLSKTLAKYKYIIELSTKGRFVYKPETRLNHCLQYERMATIRSGERIIPV